MTSTNESDRKVLKKHVTDIMLIRRFSIVGFLLGAVIAVLDILNFPEMVVILVALLYYTVAMCLTVFIRKHKKFVSEVRPEIIIQNSIVIWFYIVCSFGLYSFFYSKIYWRHPKKFASAKWNGTNISTQNSSTKTGDCLECHSTISADAKTCPYCDYSPEESLNNRASSNLGWAIVFAISIIGLVVAIPLWNRGKRDLRIVKQVNLKPTNTDPDIVPTQQSPYL